ncbi:unnamed protein product [Paramecium pentaurelia]|uniref:Uncharacterized protein n=1 Tax=Paramecium pentaurelia TaxID=43138 RepID=A0A8S1WS97_9CILI|nr:unnamed protein product [Paramecium pentaurelia]
MVYKCQSFTIWQLMQKITTFGGVLVGGNILYEIFFETDQRFNREESTHNKNPNNGTSSQHSSEVQEEISQRISYIKNYICLYIIISPKQFQIPFQKLQFLIIIIHRGKSQNCKFSSISSKGVNFHNSLCMCKQHLKESKLYNHLTFKKILAEINIQTRIFLTTAQILLTQEIYSQITTLRNYIIFEESNK